MPPRPASRPWDGRNHCGGSRAAAPDADLAVLTVPPGSRFVERLRQALAESPAAKRVVIREPGPSPSGGEQGGGYPISVVTAPITDTCKEVVDGLVRRTVPRETLVEVRGPWLFAREGLADALSRALGREGEITDTRGLCEAAGVRVRALPMP